LRSRVKVTEKKGDYVEARIVDNTDGICEQDFILGFLQIAERLFRNVLLQD
jgi:hypothetical protein